MVKFDNKFHSRNCERKFSSDPRSAILAVDATTSWKSGFGELLAPATVEFADLSDIDEGFLATRKPAVVLSPVVSRRFDCTDVAAILARFRFSGLYRAVAEPLPNPGIVRREVQAQYPGVDFDILAFGSDELARLLRASSPL